MNIVQRVFRALTGYRSLSDPNSWLVRHFGGPSVKSGVSVDENTATRSTAVFACVRILSDTVASLPLPVYKRIGGGKEKDHNNQLYNLLHDRPNPEISSFQWRKTGIAHQLLWGDWINEIEYRNNRPFAIWPIPPWIVEVKRGSPGNVFYQITFPDGEKKELADWQVLHIKDLCTDGLRGKSRVRAGAEAVGLSLAAEEFGARFYGEGANVGGIIEYPAKIKDVDGFKKNIRASYTGLGKSHRLMVLEEGTKYHRVGIPPNEAQFLELRKFQVAEIGRLFGISQLHKIGDLERATFANIEHQSIEFVVDTIRPLLINIEQEINYKLFGGKPYFAEFVIDGLLRGDTKSRNESYAIMRQNGIISANEWRALENMNPLPKDQGNMYIIPMNMIPVDQARMPEVKEPEDDERTLESRNLEQRKNSGMIRARTAKNYEHIFLAAARKVIVREKSHILKALEKYLGDRNAGDFRVWLEDFYREFMPFIKDTMRPAVVGLAEAIRGLAMQEVGMSEVDITRATEKYLNDQAQAHVSKSRSSLKRVVTKAETDNISAAEMVVGKLDDWEESRPGLIASDSTVAVSNRIAEAVFIAGGVQMLMWLAVGAEACPYCQELDGKIVSVQQPFVPKDVTLQSEDGRMPINKPTITPPLHKGCVCTIMPA